VTTETTAPRALDSLPLRALLVAEVISMTGSQMTWLALPWFVLVTTGSAAQMSVVAAAEVAAYALFGIPSGTVLSRLGARRTMLVGDAARGPLMLLIPILHWTGGLSLGVLVAVAFLLGLLSTPYGAAQRVVLPEMLGEDADLVGQASALFQGATRLTLLAGPPLAGILIGAIGASQVLVLDAATFAVSFAIVALLVPAPPEPTAPSEGEGAGGVLAGVRYLLQDRLLAAWAGAFALGDAAFTVIFVGIPVLVVGHYGENPRLAGLLLGAWGGGAILGNVVSYRVRGIDLRVLAGVVLVQALPIWLLATPVPAAVLVAALAVSGLANGIVNPTIHSLFTLRPPPDVRPKVMTASFTASTVGAPAALLAAGPAFAAWGARPVYAVAAAAQTIAMLVVGSTALRFRRTSGIAS
jgi:MFS family permease